MHLPSLLLLVGCFTPADLTNLNSQQEVIYEIAQLDGVRVGSRQIRLQRDQSSRTIRTTTQLDLTLRRYGTPVRLQMHLSNLENETGSVSELNFRQGSVGGRQLILSGLRDGSSMKIRSDDGRINRSLRWSDEVLGLAYQDSLFARKKVRTGDRFSFQRYEPLYNTVLTIHVTVGKPETVDMPEGRETLLRVDLKPDVLQSGTQRIQPTSSVVWLDKDLQAVRRQMEMDGLGTLILSRSTREKAVSSGAAIPDIGTRSLIALNRTIQRPYQTRSAHYHVEVLGADSPGALFCSDSHQQVRNVQGRRCDLFVQPVRSVRRESMDNSSAKEYLANCHFIDHEDQQIVKLARQAIGVESDPWRKALRIEQAVKRLIRLDNSADLEPASRIARNPRGDCRQHALLTAALCRASGIPARTAIGLLYVFRGGPLLGFHMWTEVQIENEWLGLDSTLGLGGISATHIKIQDHSWYQTTSLLPLLPATRILGKVRIEVVACE